MRNQYLEFTNIWDGKIAVLKCDVVSVQEIKNGFNKKYIKTHKFLKGVERCTLVFMRNGSVFYSKDTYEDIMMQFKNNE